MKESEVLRKCTAKIDEMRKSGEPAYWVKFHGNPFTRSGTPDLHITYYGVSMWLELKRSEKEKPTKLQEAEMKKWRQAGAISQKISSVEEMLSLMDLAKKCCDANQELTKPPSPPILRL